jgi:hypothetical protein
VKAVVCFGAPPAITLLICAPFLGNGDPNVDRLAAWLGYAAASSATVAILSRAALFSGLAGASKRLVAAQRVAIVGSGEAAGRLIQWLEVPAWSKSSGFSTTGAAIGSRKMHLRN